MCRYRKIGDEVFNTKKNIQGVSKKTEQTRNRSPAKFFIEIGCLGTDNVV